MKYESLYMTGYNDGKNNINYYPNPVSYRRDKIMALLAKDRQQLREKWIKEIKTYKKEVISAKELEEIFQLNEGNVPRSEIFETEVENTEIYNSAISDCLAILEGEK